MKINWWSVALASIGGGLLGAVIPNVTLAVICAFAWGILVGEIFPIFKIEDQ